MVGESKMTAPANPGQAKEGEDKLPEDWETRPVKYLTSEWQLTWVANLEILNDQLQTNSIRQLEDETTINLEEMLPNDNAVHRDKKINLDNDCIN